MVSLLLTIIWSDGWRPYVTRVDGIGFFGLAALGIIVVTIGWPAFLTAAP
jgi:hypothetical protein